MFDVGTTMISAKSREGERQSEITFATLFTWRMSNKSSPVAGSAVHGS